MSKELTLNQLQIEKATKADWGAVLELLKEAKLDYWLSGNEKYEDFYIIRDEHPKNIICCFAITAENRIGILKSFAIRKISQRRAIGSYIVNNLIPIIAKELKLKKLYLLGAKKEPFTSYYFWSKTNFIHLGSNEIIDEYFQEYLAFEQVHSSEYFDRDAAFYINISS